MDGDLGNLIQQLIDLVKQTAPELWRIALLQVRVQSVQMAIGLVVSLTLAIICAVLFKKGLKEWQESEYEDDGEFKLIFGGVVGTISLVVTIVLVIALPSLLINPEYHALKILLELVKGG